MPKGIMKDCEKLARSPAADMSRWRRNPRTETFCARDGAFPRSTIGCRDQKSPRTPLDPPAERLRLRPSGSVAVRRPDRAPPLTNRNDSITPMLNVQPAIQDRQQRFASLTAAVHLAIDAIAGLNSAERTDVRRREVVHD